MIRLELTNPSQAVVRAIQAVAQEVYSADINIGHNDHITVSVHFRDYETFKRVVSVLDEEEFYARDA